MRWFVCISISVKTVSNICHQRAFTKALKCLQNHELSIYFCMNFQNNDTEWDKAELVMKREFLITVSFCICKKTIKEPEGSALGFMVNHAPLSTWVRSVILSFRVVTRWAVSTPFSHISPPGCIWNIGSSWSSCAGGLPSLVCQSRLRNFGDKTWVSLSLCTSTTIRVRHQSNKFRQS